MSTKIDFRLMLSGSGPRFISKEIGTGALAVRRVGNMFYDKEFADVLLRHQFQSGSRIKTFLNRFQYDVQLRGCVLGQMLPESTKTIWPKVEDVLHGRDVTAWQALIDNLHDADSCRVLSLDGTTKSPWGCGGTRR